MLILWMTIALVLAGVAPAHAGFLVPIFATAAFAASAAGAALAFGLNVIGSLALSYVAGKFLNKKSTADTTTQTGGTQLNLRIDADVPQSLIVGTAVTAGSLIYANTYGKRGDIDNSDLIEVVGLADHECDGLAACCVEGVARSLGTDDGSRGQVVDGYDGNLAIKFYDGRQTSADAFTVAALGSATNAWTSAHIGRSTTYVRRHSIYNTEKVSGQLTWKYVVRGKPMYDPRKDSTVSGGSGSHRLSDLATHEWTDNPIVIAYNVLRGIYVKDSAGARKFFYGLENTAASQLPPDIWFAAMNECDVDIDLDAGGTEKQFRAGGEISVDTEPLETIKALMKCCGGRFVEIGGIYKAYVGAPGLPVMSIDDGSIVANRGDEYRPILPLESRVNYITGKYVNPDDGWIDAVAPARENLTWRSEDGRRCPASLEAPMVQSPTQMQRLMQQYLNRSRRQRKHVLPLPPVAMVLEPGDVVEWTSVRNGYEAKLFEVDGADYEFNLITTISATEVDAADYDWETTDELPVPDGLIVTTRPSPKVVSGFSVENFISTGDMATKLPGILITWEDPEDADLIGVMWQIRTVSDISNVANGSVNDSTVVIAGSIALLGGIQPITEYQVRARFVSFNGYETEWSLWLNVTTDDTRSDPADLGPALEYQLTTVVAELQIKLEQLRSRVAALLANQDSRNWLDTQVVRSEVAARYEASSAYVVTVQQASVAADAAMALLLTDLGTTVGNLSSNVSTNYVSNTSLADTLAAYSLTLASTYVTNASLAANYTNNSTLAANYVTSASLSGTLAAYNLALNSTFSALSSTVAGLDSTYATDASLASAVATWNTNLNTAVGGLVAGAMQRFVVSTTATGAIASYALEINVGTVGSPSWAKAGFYMDVVA